MERPVLAARARLVAGVAALAGLASSAALLAPYVVARGFCGPGGGCDKVAHSAYATLFGIPRALLGVIAFAMVLLVVVIGGNVVRRLAPWIGAVMAVEGVHLFLIQALVLHAFCKFCLVVDAASLVIGVALYLEYRATREDSRRRFAPVRLGLASVVVFVSPLLLALGQPKVVRSSIAPEPTPVVAGKKVLREFVDLECPYCRLTHVSVKKALASRPDIVVERHHVPLGMHEHAKEAAIAACCAGEQGKEEEFIDALVSKEQAPDTPTCRLVALQLSLDMTKYDACRTSAAPLKRLEDDAKLADKLKVEGLPTLDLEGERHVGALDDHTAVAWIARH